MPTVADIRSGFITNLRTKFGVQDWQITGYTQSAPIPPCFDIELAGDGVEYDEAMDRGADLWTWTIRALVPKTSDQGSQATLDLLIAPAGSSSVKEALESDPSLGGAADAIHVTKVSGPRQIGVPVPSAPPNVYHGCDWTVVVWARGISS